MRKPTSAWWKRKEARRSVRDLNSDFRHRIGAPSQPVLALCQLMLVSISFLLLLTGCSGNSPKSPISVSVTPASARVNVGLTAKFTASVTGSSNNAVSWVVNGKTGGNSTVGTISSAGLYTAPSTVPSSGAVTLTAISQADSNATGSSSVTILPAGTVAVSPAAATVGSGGTQQFQALINGSVSAAVSWSISNSSGATSGIGSIDGNGLYTAPASPPAPNTVVVTATSTADPSQSASANVSLVFGTGALQGQYVFSAHGKDSNGAFGRVGSIVLDGEGNVTSGVEDVTTSKGTSTFLFNSGTYTVGADGRGTLSLTNNTAGAITFYIALNSSQNAFVAESDSSFSASGTLRKQDSTAFSSAGLSGPYVFGFSGVDSGTYVNSIVGRFSSDAAGHINNGQWDQDEGNSTGHITSSGAVSFGGSSYQIDPTYGSKYGRATVSLNGLNFVFYIVDRTRSTFLQTDYPAVSTGDAASQQSVSANLSTLSGFYVFLMSGHTNDGPIVRGGRFSADGGGKVSNLILLNDYQGATTVVPSSGALTGTYTIDGNATGRGVVKFTDGNGTNLTFIFYQSSESEAVFQDASTNIELTGTLVAQTTTALSSSGFAGEYDFQWSGTNNGELDGVGQITLGAATSKNANGTFDYNTAGTLEGNLTFSGTFTLEGDGTSVNRLSLAASSDSSKSFSFDAFVVDQNSLILVGTDGNGRSLAGKVLRQ
jgi:hypothetical protein